MPMRASWTRYRYSPWRRLVLVARLVCSPAWLVLLLAASATTCQVVEAIQHYPRVLAIAAGSVAGMSVLLMLLFPGRVLDWLDR